MVTVEQGQCLMDIAVQHCGDATAIFEIAALNNIEITGLLVEGTQLLIPTPYNAAIVNYLKEKNAVPATHEASEKKAKNKGIGFMRIGSTFRIK
jgi:hypothetical protein